MSKDRCALEAPSQRCMALQIRESMVGIHQILFTSGDAADDAARHMIMLPAAAAAAAHTQRCDFG